MAGNDKGTNGNLAGWRRVPPGFRSYEAWSDELGTEELSRGRTAFIFPNVHRRRQAEEYFLSRDRHLPVSLFTPRQFAETLKPPAWIVVSSAGAALLLESVIQESRGELLQDTRFRSLETHPGARRLLLDFFTELAAAGISRQVDLKKIQHLQNQPEDRVWLRLLDRFLERLDACHAVFAPMLECRVAVWIATTSDRLPFDRVRVETGCELDIPDQRLLESLTRRGVDVMLELPLPAGGDRLPAWRPAARIADRLKVSAQFWAEQPPVDGGLKPERAGILDPLGKEPVLEADVHVITSEPGPADEIHAAYERIRRKLVEEEIAPQDAGIVLSDPYSMADRAESIARRYGLPVEVARARSVMETEAGRVARLLLKAMQTGGEPEALVNFLSSPFVSWELEDCNGIPLPQFITPSLIRDMEKAFDECRAQGPWWVWMPRLKRLAEPVSGDGTGNRRAELCCRVHTAMEMLLGGDGQGEPYRITRGLVGIRPGTLIGPREFASWVERALWNAWLPRRLTRTAAGWNVEDSIRRSFAGLTKLFDVLGSLAGEAERLGIGNRPFRDWANDLEELFRETPVPERVPSAKSVRVISPRDVPGLSFRHLEWVGLSESLFPPRRPERVWGSGEARRLLGLDQLVSESELAWSRLGFAILETAGEVNLSCPRRLGNEDAVISSPVWMIRARLKGTDTSQVDHQLSLERQAAAWLSGFSGEISSRREWSQVAKAILGSGKWGLTHLGNQILAVEPELDPVATLSGSRRGKLHEAFRTELVAILKGRPLSATRLADYARCPFYYLAVTRLGAARPEERVSGPTPLERGTLIHAVLERFYSDPAVVEGRCEAEWVERFRPVLQDMFDEEAAVFDRIFHGDAWEIEKARTRELLNRFLDAEDKVRTVSRPIAVELKFGIGGMEPFEWAGLQFSGSIDRVDIVPGQGFLIFDYKTGKVFRDNSALVKGLGFQLPLYAAAARKLLIDRITETKWLGGGYYELRFPVPGIPRPLMPGDLRVAFTGKDGSRSDVAKLADSLDDLESRYLDRAVEVTKLASEGFFPTTPLSDSEAGCDRCHLRRVCHHQEVLAETRNVDRERYGVLAEWKKPGGKEDSQ